MSVGISSFNIHLSGFFLYLISRVFFENKHHMVCLYEPIHGCLEFSYTHTHVRTYAITNFYDYDKFIKLLVIASIGIYVLFRDVS